MTQQEQFEKDYLSTFPDAESDGLFGKDDCGIYANIVVFACHCIWLQQAKRHEAEIAELVAALKECREMVGHPDNIAIIDAAIAKYEVRS